MGLINQGGLFSGAGLVDQAGLYNQAGLYVPGLFSPLSLNPLLAYEAESSMVAPFEQPTLDLDPSNPSSLDVITATRAGVATYTDADGVIQSADPNTVRVDHVDGVPMMLIEPSATNLFFYSEDFNQAGWTKEYDIVVTSSSVTSPDGTTNAFKITGLESADGDVGLFERVGASASTTYTFSAYFKALDNDDVGKKVRIRLKRNGGAFVSSNQQVVLSSEWVRHSVSITLLSDNTGVDSIITKDGSSPTEERADECLIWGGQLEEGPVATSYIPTSGSTVQRAADDLVISGSDFTDFFNTGGDGTFYAEFVPRDVLSEQWYLLAGQDYTRRFMYTNQSQAALNAYDGVNTRNYGTDMVANQINRAAFTFTATTQEASLDGSVTTPVTHNGNYLTTDRLYLASPANDKQMNGHIKRLIYWPYHSDDL